MSRLKSQPKSQSQPQPQPQLDLIIVGGGIAGLSVGLAVLHRNPNARVAILEKYGYIGGRVTTFNKKVPGISQPLRWENGAGRIATSHKNVMGLLHKYGLHTSPIPRESQFRLADGTISYPVFEEIMPIFSQALRSLSRTTLATNTLADLVPSRDRHRLFDRFPYWAETNLMRADLALATFEHELGKETDFVVCQEGLGALARAMREDFETKGGIVYLRTEVTSVRHDFSQACDIVSCIRTESSPSTAEIYLELASRATVLALHASALASIFKGSLPVSRQPSFLRHLQMAPLLRMYAVFPASQGKSWFTDIPHTITSSPIRYFIPIQPARGIVMISYTEGPDALYWMTKKDKHGEARVCRDVMKEIRRIFPEKSSIPDPIFFKMHPWTEGCTYWLPGRYDPGEESTRSIHPSPDLLPTTFVCGESTSLRQTWMEGALEQAAELQRNIAWKSFMESIRKI